MFKPTVKSATCAAEFTHNGKKYVTNYVTFEGEVTEISRTTIEGSDSYFSVRFTGEEPIYTITAKASEIPEILAATEELLTLISQNN